MKAVAFLWSGIRELSLTLRRSMQAYKDACRQQSNHSTGGDGCLTEEDGLVSGEEDSKISD